VPQIAVSGTRDAAPVEAEVLVEAGVLDGDEGADEVGRELVERDEGAVLARRVEQLGDQLRLELDCRQLVAGRRVEDPADRGPRQLEADALGPRGPARIRRVVQVQLEAKGGPPVLTREAGTGRRSPVVEPPEPPLEVETDDVGPRVERDRGRVDLGRELPGNRLQPAGDDRVEVEAVQRERQRRRGEAGRGPRGEPSDPQPRGVPSPPDRPVTGARPIGGGVAPTRGSVAD
jgi:hypothetical protein